MNFLELVNKRRSVRSYDLTRPVEPEKVERCIEAVRLAPSACNAQPWKLVVVNDPELKNKVAEAATTKWLGQNLFVKQAPLLVVLVRESPNITSKLGTVLKDKPYTIIDVGIATAHFCLQATEEGLGTCIIGWFNEPAVKKLLGIPKAKRAELIIAIGYPAKPDARKKIRKPVGEIRSFNKY
ncbi:MAG: nitroreductase family protein [Bacteroidales bacterium]|jgi:nitroreductase|nr:nitroreductase family protein [Bacteroidales bacterium]